MKGALTTRSHVLLTFAWAMRCWLLVSMGSAACEAQNGTDRALGQISASAATRGERARRDSALKVALGLLDDGQYERAAILFHKMGVASSNTPFQNVANYWEAFALYREDSEDALRRGLGVLGRTPSTEANKILSTRIIAELAARGDVQAKRQIRVLAGKIGQACGQGVSVATQVLGSLVRTDPLYASQMIVSVLSNRSQCPVQLRRYAAMLAGQISRPSSAPLLISVARGDDVLEVRTAAVTSLGHTADTSVTQFLADFVLSAMYVPLQRDAVRALGDQRSARSHLALRRLIMSNKTPADAREFALLFIVPMDLTVRELSEIYHSTSSLPLGRRVILLLERHASNEAYDSLVSLAHNESDASLRGSAIAALSRRSQPEGAGPRR